MRILILACVFIASVTGMSEATAPVRGFYAATYQFGIVKKCAVGEYPKS